MIEINVEDARRFVLDVQGLRTNRPCKSTKDVAYRIHNIQIDTISVVSRSHNLITFNRFPKYEEGEIWEIEKRGDLFEFWSHAMCMMPVETYPFYAWRRQFYPGPSGQKWAIEQKDIIDQVYKHVKKNGITHSAGIGEKTTKSTGWWDWKVEKRALEHLFTLGKLMVAYRQGFQKYYDLAERVLPAHIDSEPMTDEEAAEFVIESSLGSLGVGCFDDIRTYHNRLPSQKIWGGRKEPMEAYLDEKVASGHLEEVSIIGIDERYFILAKNVNRLNASDQLDFDDTPVKLLTPFDNIVRHREFPKRIWNFDYKIECFVPEPDRVFGYFVLPILDRNDLVGRLDAKVHRKKHLLEIKAIYLENESIKSPDGLDRLARGITDFAQFHACDNVKVTRVSPRNLTKSIRSMCE